MKHWIRNLLIIIVALAALSAVGAWYSRRTASTGAANFRTAPVIRTDVIATIGATGTLQPEEVINVGAQVAGRITEFGKDAKGETVDYGSEIKQGTILALIDPDVYQSDVDSAEAQLAQAKAGVDRAEADLAQFMARFTQAERDWARAQKLGPSDALAQVEFDTYQSSYEAAKANIAVGKASVEQAKRGVAQSQASVDRARRNLAFCTIASPVDGVIIDRRVNIGQTVVASLNAPSLFLIAKDLRRMELWVAVNEADIGQIRAGQPVTFTVDAFPGQSFRGEVAKVRLNASMTSNVVTYTVEVSTNNSAGTLLPYLTANVQFEVQRRDDVLAVPNSALRWMPAEQQIAPDAREAYLAAKQSSEESTTGGRRRAKGEAAPATQPQMRSGTVWVVDGEFVRPISVRTGLSDGTSTQVESPSLEEATEVVIGTNEASAGAAAAGTNPFAPPRFGGRSR